MRRPSYDATDARAPIGWTRRVTRRNCPCRYCAASRRADNPEHIATIVPRVYLGMLNPDREAA